MKLIKSIFSVLAAAVFMAFLATLFTLPTQAQTTNFPSAGASSNAPVFGTNIFFTLGTGAFLPTSATGSAFPNGDIIPLPGTNSYYLYTGTSNTYFASFNRSRFVAFTFMMGQTNASYTNYGLCTIDFGDGNGAWVSAIVLSNYIAGIGTNTVGTNLDSGGYVLARLHNVIVQTNGGAASPAVVGTNSLQIVGFSSKPNTGF